MSGKEWSPHEIGVAFDDLGPSFFVDRTGSLDGLHGCAFLGLLQLTGSSTNAWPFPNRLLEAWSREGHLLARA